MKKIYTISCLIFLLMVIKLPAQQHVFSDPALYKITYKFSHFYDTTDHTKKEVADMNLYVGHSYSTYRYVGYEIVMEYKQLLIDRIIEWDQNGKIGGFKMPSRNGKHVPETEYLKHLAAKKVYKKEVLVGADYVIEDEIPEIEWNIEPEVKQIGNFNTQKAVGSFRGRKYTAWFAPELPAQAGPWKLSGLPGIILEAEDEKKEVLFTCLGVERLQPQASTLIKLSAKHYKAKEAEFQRLKKVAQEDFGAFISGRHTLNDLHVTINGNSLQSFVNGVPKKPAPKTTINNPIEIVKDQ